MAKYDTYKVSLTTNSTTKPLQREITVLFEEGDPTIEIIQAADLLLVSEADMEGADIEQALRDLPDDDFRALVKGVWEDRVAELGSQSYIYTNAVQDDLNDVR